MSTKPETKPRYSVGQQAWTVEGDRPGVVRENRWRPNLGWLCKVDFGNPATTEEIGEYSLRPVSFDKATSIVRAALNTMPGTWSETDIASRRCQAMDDWEPSHEAEVVCNRDGLEWFSCREHAPKRVHTTAVLDWYAAHGLPPTKGSA